MVCGGMTCRRVSTKGQAKRLRKIWHDRFHGRLRTFGARSGSRGPMWPPGAGRAERPAMIRIEDIARPGIQLADPARERLIPLPPPYDGVDALPPRRRLSEQAVAN